MFHLCHITGKRWEIKIITIGKFMEVLQNKLLCFFEKRNEKKVGQEN